MSPVSPSLCLKLEISTRQLQNSSTTGENQLTPRNKTNTHQRHLEGVPRDERERGCRPHVFIPKACCVTRRERKSAVAVGRELGRSAEASNPGNPGVARRAGGSQFSGERRPAAGKTIHGPALVTANAGWPQWCLRLLSGRPLQLHTPEGCRKRFSPVACVFRPNRGKAVSQVPLGSPVLYLQL